jgi:hypothetical protein
MNLRLGCECDIRNRSSRDCPTGMRRTQDQMERAAQDQERTSFLARPYPLRSPRREHNDHRVPEVWLDESPSLRHVIRLLR